MRLHCVWMRYWPYNVRFAEPIKGALMYTFQCTALSSIASPLGRGGRAQRVPERGKYPGNILPLPLGEVAERSECPKGGSTRETSCLSPWERWPSAASDRRGDAPGKASLASPLGRGGRAQRVPEGETYPGKPPLPLPMGEVAERSEDGEGKQCPYPKTTPKEIIIRKRPQLPLSHLAVTALPKGEPRGCTSLHSMLA